MSEPIPVGASQAMTVRITFTELKRITPMTRDVGDWKLLPNGALLLLSERTALDVASRSKKGDLVFAPGAWHGIEVLGMV